MYAAKMRYTLEPKMKNRICTNCAYLGLYYKCTRPVPLSEPDLVKGHTKYYLGRSAYSERQKPYYGEDVCGPEAKYWKPTLRYRIINIFKKNEDSTIK